MKNIIVTTNAKNLPSAQIFPLIIMDLYHIHCTEKLFSVIVIVEKYVFQCNPSEYKVKESAEFLCLLLALVNMFALVLAHDS